MLQLPPEQWSEITFGCANLGDKRRTKRLVQTAAELSAHTGSSLAESCEGNLSSILGSYRFIENGAVQPEAIAEAGFQATVSASEASELILAIEDSTAIGYQHSARAELGDLGGPEDSKTKGFWAHSVMLLDAETERTLGLIDQHRWIRDNDQRGKKHKRKQRPYEEKESFKWQQSSENVERRLGEQMIKTISVCDREADIFEYVLYKLQNNQRFVVRATQNRTLLNDDQRLFDAVSDMPVLGQYTITVPQRGGRKERKATLQVRSKTVTIQSPQRPGGRLPPVTVNVITAQEVSNNSEDKLCWILLTTEPVKTFEDCRKILRFYELRWRIEEFHKAWKTGAGVERQRMQSADNLERMAVILMFVAVRLMQIREALMPPCVQKQKDNELWNEKTASDRVVSNDEWQVLWLIMESKKLPDKPPPLIWLFQTIAKLGGWCDSKHTGRPGWLAVWKGWAKLQISVETWRIARQFWGVENVIKS